MPYSLSVSNAFLFPAWAGVIPLARGHADVGRAFPRMGGGDPSTIVYDNADLAFPRMGGGDPTSPQSSV